MDRWIVESGKLSETTKRVKREKSLVKSRGVQVST